MDIADKAAEREAEFLAEAFYRHSQKQPSGVSLSHCEDCGEPIPQARQQAIHGVRLCLLCQEYHEAGWP